MIRRPDARRLLLASLALAALLAAAPLLAQEARELEPLSLRLGEQTATLPALLLPEGPHVSLKGVAAALGGTLAHDPDEGRFRLAAEGGALELSLAMPGLARAGARTVSLGGDAVPRADDLFVPEAAVPRLLALLRDAGPAPEPALSWSLVGAGPGRLALAMDLPAVPESVVVEPGPDGVRVVRVEGAGAVEPPWTRKALGSPLVEALEAGRDGAVLTLTVEPGPRLGTVRASARPSPPGVEVLLVARPEEAAGAVSTAARRTGTVRRVVIDPGHGGSEDGAIAPNGLKEKELTLDVARRLRALLRLEGFEVVLTRDGDDDVSLDDRAGVANEARADLFVSLHANASAYRGAVGAETFFLAPEATDDEARTLAALENNAARADGTPVQTDGELPMILWDMAQVGYLEESARLAETIQKRLNRLLDIRDRGVRQAPFRVLVGATCPAVLVELGFLSNADEARRLAQSSYRQQLAEALRDALSTFRQETPGDPGIVLGDAR